MLLKWVFVISYAYFLRHWPTSQNDKYIQLVIYQEKNYEHNNLMHLERVAYRYISKWTR